MPCSPLTQSTPIIPSILPDLAIQSPFVAGLPSSGFVQRRTTFISHGPAFNRSVFITAMKHFPGGKRPDVGIRLED